VNRDAKTQSALIALARTRRMQRAHAHAYLHRNAPMPTLRASLGYMTGTACISDESTTIAHRMSLLGIARLEGVAYVVEELGEGQPPIVYRLFLRGPRQGYLVPVHTWYQHADAEATVRLEISQLALRLEPAARTTSEAWMLSTRIVHRRALRVPGTELPIRAFALQLSLEPVSGHGSSGKTTVTAFLRPTAQLVEVWAVPGTHAAIARISYTGIPSGLGHDKDTVILLTSGLYGVDDDDDPGP